MTSVTDTVSTLVTDYAMQRGLPLPDAGLKLDKAMADYGLESLDQVAIVADLEETLGVALDDEAVAQAKTLADLIDLVEAAQAT